MGGQGPNKYTQEANASEMQGAGSERCVCAALQFQGGTQGGTRSTRSSFPNPTTIPPASEFW